MVLVVVVLWAVMGEVGGHGYLTSPAARNCAWRFDFDTPANYNYNELFCGGREVSQESLQLDKLFYSCRRTVNSRYTLVIQLVHKNTVHDYK